MGNYKLTKPQAVKMMANVASGMDATNAGKEFGLGETTARRYAREAREIGVDAFIAKLDDDLNMPMPQEAKAVNREPYIEKNIAPAPDAFGRLILKDLPDTVLVISDLQFPFAHKDCFNFLAMVAQFFKLFPRGYGLHSNHGAGRIRGAYQRAFLPNALRPKYEDFLQAPRGWAWYTEIRLGKVLLRHGDGEKGLTKPMLLEHTPAEYGEHYSVCHGHVHEKIGRQANVTVGDEEFWAAYTGCLIDPYAHAFGYTKGRKAKLGCGVITHGEWKTVRLKQDNDGRWVGKL